MADKIVPFTPEEIEWEEPGGFVRGALEPVVLELARMTPALKKRAGQWAVLTESPEPTRASSWANQLRKRFPAFEFAGRRVMTGGSRVYVRVP